MSTRRRVHALAIDAEIDRESIAGLRDIARFLTDWMVEHGNELSELGERLTSVETELSQPLVDDLTPEGALRGAIDRQAVVTFKYRDAEGESSYRVVSPYEIEEKPGFLSLVAWDHGREAPRHFRIERIEGLVTCTSVEAYREPQER